MNTFNLGYTEEMEKYRIENGYEDFRVGRVILEHKERYILKNKEGEYDAEILGQMRYKAESRSDFPAVGDWVVFQEFNEGQAIIYDILPRLNTLERKAVGKEGDRQLIAANIDTAFIIVAVDRDFSINRIQRYLTIVLESRIEAVIVLNKIDLIESEKRDELKSMINNRIPNIPIIITSCESDLGLASLLAFLKPNQTYCLLGSSGVGKSTLLNKLSGKKLMETAAISETIVRGKHTTSHRELVVLENGSMIIDNPGMREVGMVSVSSGIEETFDNIVEIASACKFSDCKHLNESGCAVIKALENREISQADYDNYMQLQKEQEHFESSEIERKQKGKALSKHIKNYYKSKKR
ncbi:ribosome small subunit-dependent GTPase A [Paracrocinitomix mangrovi]|uniref:ribosome small subunit-dependent GTPase A n=1 Tax=Paracrocinitomix mangrovi TaxID=2862509 RepID=UPI001C8E3063|nr:ribosome small subunit-dependent GTPase A [Paracrocinitomix mangrovi]UKN01099.1 ribosome small subunit-dependent GTPase A [Paracrocinitomix mangrovi]